jgi:hypothetical protein
MLKLITKFIITTYYLIIISILTITILLLNKVFHKSRWFIVIKTRYLYYLSEIAFSYHKLYLLSKFLITNINSISKQGIIQKLIFKSIIPVFKGKGSTIHFSCHDIDSDLIYFYIYFTLTNQKEFRW